MGPLEDELKDLLDHATKRTTPALDTALSGAPVHVADPIGELVMPMLAAQREAILRLARAIDER